MAGSVSLLPGISRYSLRQPGGVMILSGASSRNHLKKRFTMQDISSSRLIEDLKCAGAVISRTGDIVEANEAFRKLFFTKGASGKLGPDSDMINTLKSIKGTAIPGVLKELTFNSPSSGIFCLDGYPVNDREKEDELYLVIATPSVDKTGGEDANARMVGNRPEKLLHEFSSLVGYDPDFNHALMIAQRAAQTDHPILIMGESGTGKEILASTIHKASHRRKEAFVDVNCAAIPDSLVESELFGYEKGAFTGANSSGRQGYFQDAHQGSLFMDEIGDAAPQTQAKLLRVLEDGHFKRVGGNRNIKVDVRLISATNQELEQRIDKGFFRKDLFYRINTIMIKLPPLRERLTDLPYLVEHFLMFAAGGHKTDLTFSEETMDCLNAYPWPGNVRELKGVVDFAVTMATDSVIGPDSLPGFLCPTGMVVEQKQKPPSKAAEMLSESDLLEPALRKVERAHIKRVLEQSKTRSEAIRRLGISRRTFYIKIKQYGLE